MAKKILTYQLSQPLNDVETAKAILDAGDGNLTIDSFTGDEPVLASGALEYQETQERPIQSMDTGSGQAAFILRASRVKKQWSLLPWSGSARPTTWQVHLNPGAIGDIDAHSNGGNMRLDLASMQLTHISIDNGGGNIDVALPEQAANLDVRATTGGGGVSVEVGHLTGSNRIKAASGAGNVTLHLPAGLAARIQATSGMGKVVVAPCFSPLDKKTYQSPGYDQTIDRVEISAESGLGNVIISLDTDENRLAAAPKSGVETKRGVR